MLKTTLALMGVGLLLVGAPAVRAQDGGFTVQTVIDRAEIEDLLQRYYNNFGKAEDEAFASFYADDAQLVWGGKTYTGKAQIVGAYKAVGGGGPAAGRFSFNVLLTNPVITVRGNAATAQAIYTEVVKDTASAPPRLLTGGREYDNLAKINGHWRFTKRQIVSGTQPPAGWTN